MSEARAYLGGRVQVHAGDFLAWPFGDLEPGKYRALVVDPPWGFKVWSGSKKVASRGSVTPYETMEMSALERLPVGDLAAGDAAIFLWVVWPTLPGAIHVMEAWGFKYKTCAFCWMKADPYRLFAFDEDVYMGLGYWTRANSEVCLLGTKGNIKRKDAGVRQGIIAPRREHSRKPEGIHQRIERLVDGPYLELFARQSRPGWDSWGNELGKFSEGRRVTQPRRTSALEAATQAAVGQPIGWAVVYAVAMIGLSPVATATLSAGLMFIVSVVRGYIVRRQFERRGHVPHGSL